MILPTEKNRRDILYRNLAREGTVSVNERRSRNMQQRSAYLTGTDNGTRALYNRLREWADESAANLYDPASVRWDVAAPEHYGDKYMEEEDAARQYLAQYWMQSGAALEFDKGVEWAHPFDSVVFKVVANDNRPVLWMLTDPADLGVPEENQPSLDQQEFMVHYYDLNLSAFDRLIAAFPEPKKAEMRAAAAEHASPPRNAGAFLPAPVQNIIFTTAQYPPAGAVLGVPNVMMALAKVQEPCARMAELWVRDDRAGGSFVRVTIHVPTDTVIHEESAYPTYGMAHPFHKLTLCDVPGYLWGLSPMEGLLALQMWREKRMAQVDLREDLQLDPPLLFAGVTGMLTDEQAKRVRTPGGNVYSQYPNAGVQPILAPMPPDAFALVESIDRMFNRQAGTNPGLAGEGQPNVRSGEQQFALAALSAPRMRRKAARVEACLSAIGTQMLNMLRNVDGITLPGEGGREFFLSQLPNGTSASVSAHSASPFYEQSIKADAVLAQQAGAIDNETFVGLLSLPFQRHLRAKSQRRAQLQAEVAKGQLGREDRLVKAKETTADAAMVRAQADTEKAGADTTKAQADTVKARADVAKAVRP